jgi:potassium efflux system protein
MKYHSSAKLLGGLVLACVCLLPCFRLAADEPAGAVTQGSTLEPILTQQQIADGRKSVDSNTTLDDGQRQKALELYDQAAKWLQQGVQAQSQLAQFVQLVEEAPQRIEAIRSGKRQSSEEMPDIEAALSHHDLAQVELALNQEQLLLNRAREANKRYTDELTQLLVGSKGLTEEIASLTRTIEQIDADLKAPVNAEPPALLEARELVLTARRKLRQADLDRLRLRLANHDLLSNLLQAERDLASAEIVQHQVRLDTLNAAAQRLSTTQAREAYQQAEALRTKTEALPRPLQIVAEENSGYRHELENLVDRIQTISSDLQATGQGLDDIKSDYQRTQQRVEMVGASEAIGKMLKRRREELPSLQSYLRTSALRADEVSTATDRQIDIDELLREQGDVASVVAKTLNALPEGERADFEAQATELAVARRDTLNELQKVYGRYISQVTALDLAKRELAEVARAYIDYIDDQMIWIPGPGVMALIDPVENGRGLLWILTPSRWLEATGDAWALLQHRPLQVALVVVVFLTLLRRRKRAVERLAEIAHDTYKIRTDSFRLTLLALYYTLVAVGAWPLLLVGIGGLLETLPTARPFSIALGAGMVKAGSLMASIRFIIQSCGPDGLGDRHLRWPQPVREALVRGFSWILPIAVPLGFFVAATLGNEPPRSVQSLGRFAFIVLMIVSAVFVFRLLRRRGKIITWLTCSGGGPLLQLHFLWFPFIVMLPVVFAVTSALGYHYTAFHLEQRAEQTFWFFFGLFLVKELLLRWLYVAERRLRFEDAIRRREELKQRRDRDEEPGEDESQPIALEIPEVDYSGLNEQNKRMVRAGFLLGSVVGIWSIWSDMLPALSFLNTTELPLHASRIVDGVAQQVPVTLGDLTMGLIIVIITVLAAKNIPGVMEIALLQRLPLDAGARYAITSLSRYAIAGIGVFAAFSNLGLEWSSIQWLVAALSVGLGFGLQEIVANFISGIILLFERPIRVGDVVTIDSTTGTVSRIRIRATTIINWEKQELLIPNKEFITGRVINWTLSDKINRVVVTVGVAYGSDVTKAMSLMLQAAEENENVLDDPKPVASFEAFGDNALTLLLRAYLGAMDNRLATITALHEAINRKFDGAGISIAFPQRDLHLNTNSPLEVRLHPAGESR